MATSIVDKADVGPVVDVDIFSQETRQNWRALAAEWATRPPFYVINHGVPQLLVTRYADVKEVFLDSTRFSPSKPSDVSSRFDPFMGLRGLQTLSGPPHQRIRRILQPWFNANGVAGLEADVERIVHELIDAIESSGPEFDAMSQFSHQLIPRIILGLMLGIDDERQAVFIRMNGELESVAALGGYSREYVAAFEACRAVVDAIIAERTETGDEHDFIGALIAGRRRGEPISDDEITAQVFTICAAAMSTTATTTSMTLLAFTRHREQFDLLRSEPELLSAAVDESLRLHPAGLFVKARFVAEDTEMAGTAMRKGTPIHRCVAAANLDPTVFPEPLRFDIRRSPKHIMTFGAGPHFCVGALLARLIVGASLRAFMDRVPGLSLVDPDFEPVYGGQLGELAPRELPMRLS